MSENIMNAPVESQVSDKDIIREYQLTGSKRTTARKFCIKVSEVTAVPRKNQVSCLDR